MKRGILWVVFAIIMMVPAYVSAQVPDIYEVDNSASTANTITEKQSQYHNFHVSGDTDWVAFYTGGGLFDISAGCYEARCNPRVELFAAADLVTPIASAGDGIPGSGAYITDLEITNASIYYIKVSYFGDDFGEATGYWLYLEPGGMGGSPATCGFGGFVTDACTGQPVQNFIAFTENGGEDLCMPCLDGYYFMIAPCVSGVPTTLTILSDGYTPHSQSIYLDPMDPSTLHVNVTLQPIDTDSDGVPDDGDHSGTVGDTPCTGGVKTNCDDNCQTTCNSQQRDADGDGIGDTCDPSPGCGGCGQPACESAVCP